MQVVHFEAPDPPKGGLWSYSQAIAALPIDKKKFFRLQRLGIIPRGIRAHGKAQYRLTRKHMAQILAYLEGEGDYYPPPDVPEGEKPADAGGPSRAK